MNLAKSSTLLTLALACAVGTASAAEIDMGDPRRALGRENDVRIDAQILQDTVSPGSPIGVTYQIQNLTNAPVAVADKVASASYDLDTQTITIAIGSETPQETLPRMILVQPGEKKVLRASATPVLAPAATRGRLAFAPRYVLVKVSILRNLAPFRTLIANQSRGPQPIPDELFETWFESNDTIFLNSLPIRFAPRGASTIDAESQRGTY